MRLPETLDEYYNLGNYISKAPVNECYEMARELFRRDLFFLLRFGCGRKDMEHPWLIERCKEVQENPDGYLDLWSRDHYKSTCITFGLTIKDLLASYGANPDPKWEGKEPVFAIFSHTRSIAKGFLRQIKRELETNELLQSFFPDIIWENPSKDAPKWSEDDGLILKRKSNPKESTISAAGIVEGQPTSAHFDVMIYDDVVTLSSVGSSDMRRKTLEAWEMSVNLGSNNAKKRIIGTRYHYGDTYRDIIKRKAAIPRIHPGLKGGEIDIIEGQIKGTPVLKTMEWMQQRLNDVGIYTFSSQILQNPVADKKQSLHKEWISYSGKPSGDGLNKYLIIDPASEKKKNSDFTSMFIIGLGMDENYYVLDMIRDRLNLTERADAVFSLHRRWKPLAVGYEKYGLQADIEHIKDRQRRENYNFKIIELGGQMPKNDRIKRLVPSLSAGRWFFPDAVFKTDYEGKTHDLVDVYMNEEYLAFPVSSHDDMLDCQSRILDAELNAIFPRIAHGNKQDRYARASDKQSRGGGSSWAV